MPSVLVRMSTGSGSGRLGPHDVIRRRVPEGGVLEPQMGGQDLACPFDVLREGGDDVDRLGAEWRADVNGP